MEVRREIGRIEGAAPGPTLVVIAGMHGNEPAGVEAARRVLARVEGGRLRGEFLVLAGNLESMRAGVRYQSKDLNRVWTEARVQELRALPESARDAEDREQVEILSAIEAALGRARGRLHLCDLHTTSAAGIPFVLFGDTPAQLQFAQVFPIPIILGLEEQLDGVLTSYWTRRGCVTAAVEGGQHADPATVDNLEAVLWLALAQAGVIDAAPEVSRAAALLDAQRKELPRVLEVLSRRAVSAADEFRMEPGFRNIDLARKGQLLARDKSGEIRAPRDGIVIMPLYQGLGGDGFFWGREVRPGRLRLSRLLRPLRPERLLGLLPGVARDGRRFVVDTSVARIRALEFFQLLGYRRVRQQGSELIVERQSDA